VGVHSSAFGVVSGAAAGRLGSVELPVLHRRHQLLALGFTDGELRRLRRTGRMSAVRPGAYLPGAPPDSELVRHALAATAVWPALAGDAVFSHVTAAVLYGLPVWRVGLDRVHVTRARSNGGRARRAVHVHAAPLHPGEIGTAAGLPVTCPARTVVDLARTVPFERALAVADAALHTKLVTPDQLAAAVLRAAGWPGVPAARRVVEFADGRSESVGESRSRVAIQRAGLPTPVPQWEVTDHRGRSLGRVDFGWAQLRTVGEFDGMVKYGRLLKPGQSVADVVLAEKHREDAIRATGLAMVRWTWDDLAPFTDTADTLRHRFRLGEP
jgi:hypothetical protein